MAYCPQCSVTLCEECVKVHRSLKILKSHTTVPLSKAVSECSIARTAPFVCVKHAEKQRLYCMECEVLICALCHSVGDHKTHSVLFVDDEIGEKNKSTLKSCIASAERSIEKVTKALGQVERSVVLMHRQSENAKVEITHVMDHLVAIIRARQAALIGEVDQLEERVGRELQRHKEKLSQQLSELNQFKLLTGDLLQHGIPEEQISLKRNVVERTATITATPLPVPPPSCNNHFDSSAIKETIEDELSHLGSLTCGACPQNCTVEDLRAPFDEGVLLIRSMPLMFTVITRNKDNKRCQGGDKVLAILSPSSRGVPVVGRVEDSGDGTYQVQFDTLPAPHCKLRVTVNGGHTKGSPLVVKSSTVDDIGKVIAVYKDPMVKRRFQALAVGSDGVLLATDDINGEVCVFNQTGRIVRHFQLKEVDADIEGIAELQVGNIAVSNYEGDSIQVYTASGQFVQQFASSVNGASGLAVNGRGQLFVAGYCDHKVSVFHQNGHHQYSFGSKGNGPGQFKNPGQICIAPDGLVYVSDCGNGRVQVFEQEGKFVREFGNDVLNFPKGITVTKDGHVVVASFGANKLSIFTLEGQCVREITGIGLCNPYAAVLDASGWLYVADYNNCRILKL